jgi:DHA3 family macrolide efflux protein-like MFS transporter
MIPMVNGPVQAIMQASVEPAMQGRVLTLASSIASGMAPLGLLLAGPLAEQFGVTTWYITAGVVCVLVGVAGFFIPAVMDVEDNRGGDKTGNVEPIPEPQTPAATTP